jgi:hypothetical protein
MNGEVSINRQALKQSISPIDRINHQFIHYLVTCNDTTNSALTFDSGIIRPTGLFPILQYKLRLYKLKVKPQEKNIIPDKIGDFIKIWITLNPRNFQKYYRGDDFKNNLEEFIIKVLPERKEEFDMLVDSIPDVIDDIEYESNSKTPREVIPWLFTTYDNHQIARLLTYLEYKFVTVHQLPEEYLTSEFTKDTTSCPNIAKSSFYFNFMSGFVHCSILYTESEVERKEYFSRWVDIAFILDKMKNFSGAFTIICALQNSIFSKLALEEKLKCSDPELWKIFETMCLDYAPNRIKTIFVQKMKKCDEPFIPIIQSITQLVSSLLEFKQDNYALGLYDFKTREKIGDLIQIIVKSQKLPHDFSDLSEEDISRFTSSVLGVKLYTEEEKFVIIKLTSNGTPKREKSQLRIRDIFSVQTSPPPSPRTNQFSPRLRNAPMSSRNENRPRNSFSRTMTMIDKFRKSTNFLPRTMANENQNENENIESLAFSHPVTMNESPSEQTPQSPRKQSPQSPRKQTEGNKAGLLSKPPSSKFAKFNEKKKSS